MGVCVELFCCVAHKWYGNPVNVYTVHTRSNPDAHQTELNVLISEVS